MDVHQHQHQHQHQYAQSDGHLPAYDPSHSHSYEAHYYSSYPQPQYDPSAAYSHHHYYDYSAAYQQPPPPPGVDHAHPHHYMPAPQQPDAMEVARFSHEYAVLMDGGSAGVSSQGGGGRFPFRGRGGRRGGRGGIGRGNFRGRGRGRGGGRAREPAQPPAPKPARQPKPHAWCDICRVDCNSVEILEQHRAGKRHKRTVQRIQEYEAQQKQLAGYHSADISTTTGETGLSVSGSATQTLTVPVAASATAFTSEAGSSNHPGKLEIHEEQKRETVGQNQPATGGPSESFKTEASETQPLPPSETNQADTAPSGKRSFTKRPRPDGYGLGFIYGYGGGKFDRGGRRGGRFDRGGKRPRRFGEYQPWPPMAMQMPMMPPHQMMSPMPGPGMASRSQRVRPIVCMVCNISCDTPAVFETHVAGKKHQTRISKCQDPNQVFGPLTVFIPPGQPTPHPQNGPEPVFYGLTTPEEIKQYEMLMRDETEDKGEEEEACGDDQQDGNLEERAEDDCQQDIEMTDNETNDATNADQCTLHNEFVMGSTPGIAGSIATDGSQNTEVTPNDSDAVAVVQTMSELFRKL